MTWYPAKVVVAIALIAAIAVLCFFGVKHPDSVGFLTIAIVPILAVAQAFLKPVAESNAAAAKTADAVKAASTPPPPPVAPVATILALIFTAKLLTACGANVPSAADQEKVKQYAAEQLACVAVEKAKFEAGLESLDDADKNASICRNKVKVKYGRLDAGAVPAPTGSTPSGGWGGFDK